MAPPHSRQPLHLHIPCASVHSAETPHAVSRVRLSDFPIRRAFDTLRDNPPPDAHGLTHADLPVVFQPIVALDTGRLHAYEVLTRCSWPSLGNPEVLFRLASEEGVSGRLGRFIRQRAIAEGSGFPLFVNIHPDELSEPWLIRPDDALFSHDHDIYLEITEAAAFSHHELCLSVLREIQSRAGVYLAVDDLGAGHSNLKRVLDLDPQVVKLDRTLVTGLHQSVRQQILVRQLVRLFEELGATVVAEGIETAEEFRAVVDTGVHLAQGFFLGRPAFPPPPVHWPQR